jgi:hypothetical protein
MRDALEPDPNAALAADSPHVMQAAPVVTSK